MTKRSVLVSGASVAGPALAYWLRHFGMEPVVMERAAELRPGGQNVDVRGAGREVARRMGIEGDIRDATTGEVGVRFVDSENRTRAEFPAGTSDSGGPTAELEILRGDLAQILFDRTAGDTEYIFGDHVTGLDDRGGSIRASFMRANDRDFDLVIAADGIRSTTRALALGDEPKIRELGLYTAYFTVPRTDTDTRWARWYNAERGRTITLRPDNVGTTRATLSFLSEPRGYEEWLPMQQKKLLVRVFRNAGWETPRLLAQLERSPDVYFESIGQVKAPRWSRGRFAMVGDAAYCASPISGMGTSLALVGAYVLAGELSRTDDHREAFDAYERLMRPYVDQAQQLPPGAPRLANPRTKSGIAVFNAGLRLASSKRLTDLFRGRIGSRLFTPPADKIDLPDY